MAWGKNKGSGCGLAGLALLVALAALFVAWSAYRRTGGSLGQLVPRAGDLNEPFKVGEDGGGFQGALARARARLAGRRAEVADERNLEQVRRDVAEIRASLERAYRSAGAPAKEKWRDLDGDLQRLEEQLRRGGRLAVAALDEALDKMRR